jgi:hypothetical protein
MARRLWMVFVVASLAAPAHAAAQQTLTDTLSFLLINRSIPTGDFTRDELAAVSMRDAIIGLLQAELATVPLASPAGGFTYRLDPDLGIYVRTSDSFGPFFVERSVTGGRGQFGFGLGYSQSEFDNIDGRPLADGTLVATASQLAGEAAPFDAETLTLRMQTRTATFTAHAGLTDRLDVSVAVPFVRVSFTGTRLDTYRGFTFEQARAAGAASGVGDVVVRGKYNVWRQTATGVSVAVEARLPTGDDENLLGSGSMIITPRVIGSIERGPLGGHGSVGYAIGGPSDVLDLGAAVTVAATSRLTVVGEFLGRRINEGGRLIDVTEPHPALLDVTTIRLSATPEATTRALVSAGIRWNAGGRGLLSANVLRPLSTAGLNARWVATIAFDYSFGG